jgi:hypothetical protein
MLVSNRFFFSLTFSVLVGAFVFVLLKTQAMAAGGTGSSEKFAALMHDTLYLCAPLCLPQHELLDHRVSVAGRGRYDKSHKRGFWRHPSETSSQT